MYEPLFLPATPKTFSVFDRNIYLPHISCLQDKSIVHAGRHATRIYMAGEAWIKISYYSTKFRHETKRKIALLCGNLLLRSV